MQSGAFKYFIFSNLIAAVLLVFSFEPLSETAEVASEKAIPILKQLSGGHDQQVGYVEHMLSSMRTQATRTKTVMRIVAAWLIVNAAVSWRCLRSPHRTGGSEAKDKP